MPLAAPRFPHSRMAGMAVFLVALGGVVATLVSFRALRSAEEREIRAHFETRAITAAALTHLQFRGATKILAGLSLLYEGSNDVTHAEFLRATQSLQTDLDYKGSLAWMPRDDGRFPIREQEGIGRSPIPMGTDLGAVPELRAAMEQACATYEPAASLPVTLPGSQVAQPLVYLFRAAREHAETTSSAEGPVMGLVVFGLDPIECLELALRGAESFDFEVWLFAPGPHGDVAIASLPAGAAEKPGSEIVATRSVDLRLKGLAWRLEGRLPRRALDAQRGDEPWIVLGAGLLLTAALAGFIAIVAGYTHGVEDVVARQTAQLVEWKARYEDAAQASRLVLYDWLAATNRVVLGGEVHAGLGFAPGVLAGGREAWAALVHPEDRERYERETRALATAEDPPAREYRIKSATGTWLDVRDEARVVRDAEGRPVRVTGFVSDVTALRRAEAVLRRSKDSLETLVRERTAELEVANRELESFSYSVSHDLRAPLRAVNGFARILIEDHGAALSTEARRCAETILDSGEHMGRLIDELLAFSRTSRKPLAKVETDLDDLLAGVWKGLPPERTGGVETRFAPLGTVLADPELLRQVFANLVDNAVKFSRRVERPVVEVGCEAEGGERVWFVRDNGAGFAPELAHKLFGVFQRLHRADEFEGTGVGLALVRRIVERHGGRIWAESTPGKGATFRFTLGTPPEAGPGAHA